MSQLLIKLKSLKCWASQNDGKILSFVKAYNVVGKKRARRGRKMAIYLVRFISDQSLVRSTKQIAIKKCGTAGLGTSIFQVQFV